MEGLVVFVAVAIVIFWVWLFFAILHSIFSSEARANRPRHQEEDFWDDVDGGTYVTMPDGSVRLDNNGIVRMKIERTGTNARPGASNQADGQ